MTWISPETLEEVLSADGDSSELAHFCHAAAEMTLRDRNLVMIFYLCNWAARYNLDMILWLLMRVSLRFENLDQTRQDLKELYEEIVHLSGTVEFQERFPGISFTRAKRETLPRNELLKKRKQHLTPISIPTNLEASGPVSPEMLNFFRPQLLRKSSFMTKYLRGITTRELGQLMSQLRFADDTQVDLKLEGFDSDRLELSGELVLLIQYMKTLAKNGYVDVILDKIAE